MSGPAIELQTLPSQQQHGHNTAANIVQSTPNNANSNATASQPPISNSPSPSQIFETLTQTIKTFWKSLFKALEYWFRPFVCLVIYSVTVYVAWSAPTQHALLGRVRASFGTWLLAIFAKAGDICFAFAVEDMFDTIAWRKVKMRDGVRAPVKLEWFLSVVPSTGIEGLSWILWRRLRRWVVKIPNRFRRWTGMLKSMLKGQGSNEEHEEVVRASLEQKWRQWWKKGVLSRWTFARLMFVAILIPGPGIILLADIDQTTVCFDLESMNISAGLATFDPEIANATRLIIAPLVSRYIQVMLQDRSLSWPVDAIDPTCNENLNCTSYLIAGPYSTVAPWPFSRLNESVDVDGFRIKHAPYYQVDMWDPKPNTTMFSQSRDCVVYGGLDSADEFSTLVCIPEPEKDNVLLAGWSSCQLGYSPTNGSCLEPGNLAGWATFFRFYRRNATLVFSRSGLQILEVTDLSDPRPQSITAAAIFTALDAILYRPDQASPELKFYDVRSSEYLLTQTIGVQLWQSLYPNAATLNIGRDWLRNLVSLPVYLFQPTSLALSSYLLPITAANGTKPAPNLPGENYVEGSYCAVSRRSIPGRETVYTYAAVAGFLLAFVLIAKARALFWVDAETSDFAVLDYQVLALLTRHGSEREEVSLRERLDAGGRPYGTGAVLDAIGDLRVGLR